VTKVLSTEEVKRAIEGSGKDFGKSTIWSAQSSYLSARYLDGYENDFRVRLAETNSALECSPNLQVLNNTIEHATKS
jgi:hypothetical protein